MYSTSVSGTAVRQDVVHHMHVIYDCLTAHDVEVALPNVCGQGEGCARVRRLFSRHVRPGDDQVYVLRFCGRELRLQSFQRPILLTTWQSKMKRDDWSRAVQYCVMFTNLNFRMKKFYQMNPHPLLKGWPKDHLFPSGQHFFMVTQIKSTSAWYFFLVLLPSMFYS